KLAAQAPHAISVEIARPVSQKRWSPDDPSSSTLTSARFQRTLDQHWRRTSYSALTSTPQDTSGWPDPETPVILDEPQTVGGVASELPLSTMASGPRVGTVIHRLLAQLDFACEDLPAVIHAGLRAATADQPQLLKAPLGQVAAGLALALGTPLGAEFGPLSLTAISRADRLDELQFEMPLAGGDLPVPAATLADLGGLLEPLIASGQPLDEYGRRLTDPSLASVLRGYLTGSIDLVARIPGRDPGSRPRYAIIDYKTNWLAPPGEPLDLRHYRQAALVVEMQRAHYVLQGLLYAVALHRYLRWRLPDYDPDTDLAGIHYLFLRGMLGPDHAGEGVFHWHPPAALLCAVSDLLAGGERE
ncbi:MAG: hypothetical protein ACP5H2_10065, partial [Solirubrobacteraceae bacterium]